MEDPTSQVFRRKNKESFRVHHEGNDEDASQLMNGETQCDCRESCGENLEGVEIRSHNLLQTSRIHPQVHITSISWTTTDELMTQMLRPRHIASSAKTEWLLRMSKLVSVVVRSASTLFGLMPINVIKAPQGLTADNCKSTAKWSEHVNHGKWLWPIEYQTGNRLTFTYEQDAALAVQPNVLPNSYCAMTVLETISALYINVNSLSSSNVLPKPCNHIVHSQSPPTTSNRLRPNRLRKPHQLIHLHPPLVLMSLIRTPALQIGKQTIQIPPDAKSVPRIPIVYYRCNRLYCLYVARIQGYPQFRKLGTTFREDSKRLHPRPNTSGREEREEEVVQVWPGLRPLFYQVIADIHEVST
ncbi:uncharacterized protein LACBIDRAFT_332259 [Laccaria bicolor S238N-H82]|uniref:Predicted protein n=1 Tax=Laccaria bicolor (strain S238N-H82 / ATCC MYA-4686) TaxID=486041 RepID=B0DS45_LACBS|nr:uncharacterized protein LACBIDRAFT_332259 [Laccaria bicolor S238N-H82]EDR02727.1 predicted protein [Laccaria bicolor S238N-H82]|eukprot:XP_001886771.1 predicted protein [Laccaria bicolor S238N-H82]